jgi:hypothetical protein
MRDRTGPAWDGDRLLAQAAALLKETRCLLAEVEDLVRVSRDLRRHSRELRAARAAPTSGAPGGKAGPGR